MSSGTFHNAVILTGATGSGKSSLSIVLAEHLNAEIISMDSMAVYRGMDIGTAKPTPEVCGRVRHHLVDVLDPWESSSLAWWLDQATQISKDINDRGKRTLFVGGTPLYLKGILFGIFDGPPANSEIRSRLAYEARQNGIDVLHCRLKDLDPISGARIHPHDERRIIRALEVYELTGMPMSSWQRQWRQAPPTEREKWPQIFCLDLPREDLYRRINDRVLEMLRGGFVEEASRLLKLPLPLSREARQAVGYKELFDHLMGKLPLEKTVAMIQTRTRNLAKRQLTWFRHLPGCQVVGEELTISSWGLKMKLE